MQFLPPSCRFPPLREGNPEVCHFNIPTPTPPLNNKTPIGYPYPYYDKQQTSQDRTTRWATPQHTPSRPPPTPHQHHTPPHHTTRTLLHPPTTHPRRTHHPRTQTIAQLARTQHPYPNHIPNRYYRHCQRYFDPDAAFQHLFRHTLHAVPTDHPYTIALDGTTVPRTGAYIPGAHWTPNPANAPFARGATQSPNAS
jgi:hypothetical protein